MYYYIKTIYDQWCNGQEIIDVAHRSDDFIKMVSSTLHYSEAEVRNYLESQPWFYKSLDEK